MNILVLDVGTSSMRGILYGKEAAVLHSCQIPYQVVCRGGEVEQPASDWENALYEILKDIVSYCDTEGIEVEALSLTSQRSSVIALGKEGNPLRPAIMWQDKRTQGICDELRPKEEWIAAKTGARINNVFSGCKMRWIRQEEPEVYQKAEKLLTIADYLAFLMTGNLRTDHTYASRSLLMNIRTREWDDELLDTFMVEREKLCDLIAPGSVHGYTTKELKEKTGLPSGIPLISAGGDQQCAAVGQGVIGPGTMEITVGTGAYILAYSDKVPEGLRSDIICGAAAISGGYSLEASILTCCSAYDWFRRTFYNNDIGLMNEEITETAPGSGGCIALPYFQGRGTPDWNGSAMAHFADLTLSTTRGEMARALLEGLACEIYENAAVLEGYAGASGAVYIGGGLTNFEVYNQMQADICGRTILRCDDRESTALGAFLSAALTLEEYASLEDGWKDARKSTPYETYTPDQEAAAVYRKVYAKKQELYGKLYRGMGR